MKKLLKKAGEIVNNLLGVDAIDKQLSGRVGHGIRPCKAPITAPLPITPTCPDGEPWTSSKPISYGVQGPFSPQGPYCRCSTWQEHSGHQCSYGFNPATAAKLPWPYGEDDADMMVNAYQEEALKTADCPLIGHASVYPLLGILGELGEVVEKLDGYVFEDNNHILDVAGLEKELGDVLWYAAVISHFLDKKFSDVLHFQYLTAFQINSCTPSWGFPLRTRIARRLSGLVMASCRLSERMKKVFRDGKGEFDEVRKMEVLASIRTVVLELAVLSNLLGFTLTRIAQVNIEKLHSRRERNAIRGEGDNR